MARPAFKTELLDCPFCGPTPLTDFSIVEDAVIEWRLTRSEVEQSGAFGRLGIGRVFISQDQKYNVWDESSTNTRLYHRGCGKMFPVPADCRVDWR